MAQLVLEDAQDRLVHVDTPQVAGGLGGVRGGHHSPLLDSRPSSITKGPREALGSDEFLIDELCDSRWHSSG